MRGESCRVFLQICWRGYSSRYGNVISRIQGIQRRQWTKLVVKVIVLRAAVRKVMRVVGRWQCKRNMVVLVRVVADGSLG